jgi:hypothetical protein
MRKQSFAFIHCFWSLSFDICVHEVQHGLTDKDKEDFLQTGTQRMSIQTAMNVVVKWLTLLLHIQHVPGSI